MIFVDTNILVRFTDPDDEFHALAVDTVAQLHSSGAVLFIAPQCIDEFWAVLTRPRDKRGVGLTPTDARAAVNGLPVVFHFVPDPPSLYFDWLRLVTALSCSGKESHDARLAAFMNLVEVDRILTFNTSDFRRYAHISAISPAETLGRQ